MRVIFVEDVVNVARTGDVKEVKTGYARNYLIPKGLAVAATPQQLVRLESLQKIGMERSAKELEEAQGLAAQLDGSNVTIKVKAGPRGRLFGSVTNAMIAKEVSETLGLTVDRKGIALPKAIHELGSFDIRVRIHPEVNANISLVVESDSDISELILEDASEVVMEDDHEETDEVSIVEGDAESIEESEASTEENE
tara:strand:+ start:664 stop:1251 length:588 start_codon:yes stop_codon:yes gene_type:complete